MTEPYETYAQLKHKIEVIRARENLNSIKNNMSTTTPKKFMTNAQGQKVISELQAENASLKTQLASARAVATTTKAAAPSATAPKATATKAITAPAASASTWQKPITPTMPKAEFDAMNPKQKMSFCKSGGKITN